jgi:hypothetical protein
MHIKIHHRRPSDPMLCPQPCDRHRDIVEHTKARSLAPERMMRPTGERSTPSASQRLSRRRQSAANRRQSPLHQPFRPRKPNSADRGLTQSSLNKRPHILRIMHQFDRRNFNHGRGFEREAPGRLEPFPQQAILFDWEPMPRRKRQLIVVGIKKARHV